MLQKTDFYILMYFSDFIFPLYWDSMAAGEATKVVVLQPSSREYQTVQEGFKRTTDKSIIKVSGIHEK